MFKIIEKQNSNIEFTSLAQNIVLDIFFESLKSKVTASQYTKIKKLRTIIIVGMIIYKLVRR
jgi:hypothetical protein